MMENNVLTTALVFMVASCGAPKEHTVRIHQQTSVQRFLEILKQERSLYGLEGNCGEWLARPTEPDDSAAAITSDEVAQDNQHEEDEGVDRAESASAGVPHNAGPRGRLQTREPDAEGLMYGFTYLVMEDHGRIRLRLVGRGSSFPAPGVKKIDPVSGYGLIGSGRYCVGDVDVREHPTKNDAVAVGDETWFLSRDACLASRSAFTQPWHGCARRPK